jgi:hypothetical protein
VAATRLAERVIARLAQAEVLELNPHYRDDLRIARLTVAYAASGKAVLCTPHVLASYMVLGLHPEKVWPAILARRQALAGPCMSEAPPKKPAQRASLWLEKTNGARAVNSRAAEAFDLGDQTRSVPMAATSLTASYPNSDAPSSEKRGEYSYDDLIEIVKRSGADSSIRELTLAALVIRGRWPKKQGPVSPVITVSVRSLQEECGVWRSTIQRRIRRAQKDRFWRATRTKINSWLNCPSCGAERDQAKCPKCPHKGNGLNPNEFPRTFAYAIDIEKFASTPPCRQVREIRDLRKRRKGPIPVETQAEELRRRHTEQHQKERTVVNTQISSDSVKAAQRVFEYCGLADIGLIAKIAVGIVAEAKFQGIEIEAAAKYIGESALRDQRNGATLNAFYWRDLKWRANGGQQQNASQQRTHANRQAALGGIYREVLNDFPGEPDGPPLALGESSGGGTVSDRGQREHEPERGKSG